MTSTRFRPGSREARLLAAARARLEALNEPLRPHCDGWACGPGPDIDRTGLPWAVALQALIDHQPDAPLLSHVIGADAVIRELGVPGLATLQRNLAGGAPVDYRYTRCPYCWGRGEDPTGPTCQDVGCPPMYEFMGHDHLCPVCEGTSYQPQWFAEEQIQRLDDLLSEDVPRRPRRRKQARRTRTT